MTSDGSVEEKVTVKKFFVPSVALPHFAIVISNTIVIILAVEIALTFLDSSSPAAIGIVGQVSTINSVGEAVAAIAMTLLIVRFKEKSLLLTGILIIVVSSIGNFFAPTLVWIQVFYFLEGLGTVMIGVAGVTMLGNRLPQNKKAKALGYVYAVVFLAFVISPPLINLITGFAGWRYSYLLFVLPISAVFLLIAFLGIPSFQRGQQTEAASTKTTYAKSFKQVLLNRSALTCLMGQLLFVGPTIGVFTTPFFATRFSADVATRSYILMAASSIYIVVFLFSGSLVNKFGAKPLAAIGALLHGVLLIGLFSAPNLWFSLVFHFSAALFSALAFLSLNCLTLDQVPESRGIMVSTSRIFGKAGDAIVPAIGGLLLVLFSSYQVMAVVFAAMNFIASAFFLLTRDPNRT